VSSNLLLIDRELAGNLHGVSEQPGIPQFEKGVGLIVGDQGVYASGNVGHRLRLRWAGFGLAVPPLTRTSVDEADLGRSATLSVGARHIGPNVTFTGVTTDSRQIKVAELFVALRGERFDGHAFVEAALSAGAAAAMVEEAEPAQRVNAPLLLVRDTRRALGRLAAFWRSQFTLPLVAVTGSNGKTTVKEMTAAILERSGNTLTIFRRIDGRWLLARDANLLIQTNA
jgi:hypothetical protein